MMGRKVTFRTRVIHINEKFVAFLPFASSTPFQIWILPLDHHLNFLQADDESLKCAATCLAACTKMLDDNVEKPDYNLILRTRPSNLNTLEDGVPFQDYFHWCVVSLEKAS